MQNRISETILEIIVPGLKMTYSDDVIAHHQGWCNYDVIGLVLYG